MDISLDVFAAIFILVFFGFSIAAMVMFLQASPKLKQIFNDKEKHWALKYVIYYGIAFSMLLVATVFISIIFVLANFLQRGF